jgi:hypothetical protein
MASELNGENTKFKGKTWDDELMWESIEKELNHDRRGKRLLWIILPLIFLITTIPFLMVDFTQKENSLYLSDFDRLSPPYESKSESKTYELNESENNIKLQKNDTYSELIIVDTDSRNYAKVSENIQEKIQSITFDNDKTIDKQNSLLTNQRYTQQIPLQISQRISTIKTTKKGYSFPTNFTVASFKKLSTSREENYLLAAIGMGYPLTIDKFDEASFWQRRKKDHEQNLQVQNLSLLLGTKFESGFFIQFGLNRQELISNFSDQDSLVQKEVFFSDSAYVQFADETQYFAGEQIKTTTIYRNLDVYNKLISWSMPLNFGYRLKLSRTQFNMSVGLWFKMHAHIHGYTVSSDNTLESYSEIDDRIVQAIGLSQINLNTSYLIPLNKKWELLIACDALLPIQADYIHSSDEGSSFFLRSIPIYGSIGLKYNFSKE